MLEATTLPLEGKIAAIAHTSTAATTNLSTALGASTIASGQAFVMVSDQPVYFKTAYASGTEVSGAATSGDGRGFLLPANTLMTFYFAPSKTAGGQNIHLSLQSVSTGGTLRIASIGRQHS